MKYVGIFLMAQLGIGFSWKQVAACRLVTAAVVFTVWQATC